MNTNDLKQALELTIDAKQPLFIWGPPGVGKSAIVSEVAKERGIELRDVRMNLLDPTDLRGFPQIIDGMMSWASPDFLPTDPKSQGILFLDEMNTAPPAVQAAGYQLVLDRKIGNYTLPDGWVIVAAGNRSEDRAVVHRMSSALASRMTHVDLETDLEAWIGWAIPAGIDERIISFLRFKPTELHNFDPAERCFPSPRTWSFVSKVVSKNPPDHLQLPLIAGCVGKAAASEFLAFARLRESLPSLADILARPGSTKVPNDLATKYALAGMLAKATTLENIDKVYKYIARMPTEYSVVWIRDAVKYNPKVVTSPTYIQFAVDNCSVLLA